ncbi:hypothetical protein AB1Y20_003394 [Prymnesium parvum]|uniref:CVC domain-containing protein n=1 Tax=Prymnesium parvum TaxID=97485 RepID=A0AB34JC43_PRYPA
MCVALLCLSSAALLSPSTPRHSVCGKASATLRGVRPGLIFSGRAVPPPRASGPVLRAPPSPPSGDEAQAKWTKLLVSILIDLIGMATYIVPVAGEAGDLAWAPISALLVYQLYGNAVISGLALAEELLPGLDIIPTATIAWLLENTEFGQNLNEKGQRTGYTPEDKRERTTRASNMKDADGVVVDDTDRL